MVAHIHDWNAGNLADSHAQVLVTGGHNVAFVLQINVKSMHFMVLPSQLQLTCLRNSLHNAVVRVDALVGAVEALEPVVLDDLEGQLKAAALLLQLAQHAVGNVGNH
jgi:hypothetical protein